MKQFDIPWRSRSASKKGIVQYKFTKDDLYDRYVNRFMTIEEIAKEYGCRHSTIEYRLKDYGIEIRTAWESRRIKCISKELVIIKTKKNKIKPEGKMACEKPPLKIKQRKEGCISKKVVKEVCEKLPLKIKRVKEYPQEIKEEVKYKYSILNMSLKDMEMDMGIGEISLRRLLKEGNVVLRDRLEALKFCKEKTRDTKRRKLINRFGEHYYDSDVSNVKVGDIRSGQTIGLANGAWVYSRCGNCGVERWCSYNQMKRWKIGGWCHKCAHVHPSVLRDNIQGQVNAKDIKSIKSKEQWADPIVRKRYLDGFRSEGAIRKHSISSKKLWADPEYKDKAVKACREGAKVRPTKPELSAINILDRLYPNEWKYVGDGAIIIEGRNPDIININGKKAIVEVFGDYWHGFKHTRECPLIHELDRIDTYTKYGYKTLILWEHELKDEGSAVKKIKEFCAIMGLYNEV